MGIMIMNMSQGRIEREESVTADYSDEIMCSEWNPVAALSQLVPEGKQKSFPAELAGVDLELFLQKMYG